MFFLRSQCQNATASSHHRNWYIWYSGTLLGTRLEANVTYSLTFLTSTVTLETYKLPDSDEDVAEEEAIRRVLKQLTEEAALDEASGFNIPPDQTTQSGPSQQNLCKKAKQKSHTPATTALARADDSDEDELPWCCICNEDATLRCHGCDGDLYCQRCFWEGHEEFDLKDHHTSRYHLPCKQK